MLTLQTWAWPAIAVWVLVSVACLPLPFLPEQDDAPDAQRTIDSAVRAAMASQRTRESLSNTPTPTVAGVPPSPSPVLNPPVPTSVAAAILPSPGPTSIVVRSIPTPTTVVVATPSMTPVPTPEPTPFERQWIKTEPARRTYAPAFEGQPVSGDYFHSTSTIGVPMLLVFWAPW